MRALKYRLLSEDEVDRYERTAHNPPVYGESFTEEDFSQEWWEVRTALKRRLELFGDEWDLSTDRGDFMLSESRGDSRWIYMTFCSTRMWCPEFAPAVADLLAGLPNDYRVGCLTELSDEELFDFPLVYLVVSLDGIGAAVDNPGELPEPFSVLRRFGFPPRW